MRISPLTLWYTLEGHWPLGGGTFLLCRFLKAAQQFPIFLSSFLINAIACDRFRFIVQSHRRQMSARQVRPCTHVHNLSLLFAT